MDAVVNDGFFVGLLDQASERLLLRYVEFLKYGGASRKNNYVAQCIASKNLTFEIKNLLNLILILKHFGLADSVTPLLLERDLLLAESIILDRVEMFKIYKKPEGVALKKVRIESTVMPVSNVSETHKEIKEFVVSRGQVRNTDVFAEFSGITKRTLKRKLSELIRAGVIKRLAQGKKVFYGVN